MSPNDNSPGNHDQHLGEGGTHEVVFSNSGGKIKIETVTPDTISGATNNLASQLGETIPSIVMPPPPELDKDDTGSDDYTGSHDTGSHDTGTPDDTSDTGDDDTDTPTDTDGDGLSNDVETELGTDSTNQDSDGDIINTDTTGHDNRGTPQPLRIAVPGLKKTVEGD